MREALSLGHGYIGTEHLLLGLTREHESVAFRVLLDFDVYREEIREEIVRVVGGPGRRQADEGSPAPAEEIWLSELGLRRVLPVAQQMSDGSWLVSVEIWDHGLVIRWATAQRPQPGQGDRHDMRLRVSDDVGTSYSRWGGGRSGHPKRGYYYEAEFEPAPPPEATSLRIRRETADKELSITVTD